jgi:hypothetical protein
VPASSAGVVSSGIRIAGLRTRARNRHPLPLPARHPPAVADRRGAEAGFFALPEPAPLWSWWILVDTIVRGECVAYLTTRSLAAKSLTPRGEISTRFFRSQLLKK